MQHMNAEKLLTMKLKDQLKKRIKLSGITASQLSRDSGVPKQSISDWLAGRSPRNLDHLKKVADALSVSVDELCFGADETSRNETPILEALLGDEWLSGVFEVKLRRIKK